MRRTVRFAALFLTAAVLGACAGNPAPEVDTETRRDSVEAERARQDSIARADSIRRARERARERRRSEEARELCQRAAAAVTAGNYEEARGLYQKARSEYGNTECGRRADRELARLEKVEVVRQRIHFEFDKSRITDEAAGVLRRKAEVLRQNPDVRITIEGHCDERGSNEYNVALGQRRAESAKNYLANLGVPEEMFRTISYGEERPLVDASNEEAWAKNRRAEFVIRNVDAL